jgi:SMC interacting uncharacterized protein involved in chromosome segregation
MTEDRDAFIEEFTSQLEEWGMGLDELQKHVDQADAEAEGPHHELLRELRRDYDATREQIEALEAELSEDWSRHREGLEEARQLMEQALKEAQRTLKEKERD